MDAIPALIEFFLYIWQAVSGLRNGGDWRIALVALLALVALFAIVPLGWNSVRYFPFHVSPPMYGTVPDGYDNAGNTLLHYKNAIGEEREYMAETHLPGDKAVQVCETIIGKPFLCGDLPARKATFNYYFGWFMACLIYLALIFRRMSRDHSG